MDTLKDFTIVPLNPVKFNDSRTPIFDGRSAADNINTYQESPCFFQKWEQLDTTTIQILSEYTFTFDVVNSETGYTVSSLTPQLLETSLLNQSFSVYEVTINFLALAIEDGHYHFKVGYTNNLSEDITIESEIFLLQEKHEGTILVSYRNSENNFSVVFHEDLVFNIRLEGELADFSPSADDVIYNDQKRNATLLGSIPYRIFTFYVGGPQGIPDWLSDKANRILSCDAVTLNGEYYQKIEGAKWDVKRVDKYPFSGLTIEVMPVENRFLTKFKIQNGDIIDPSEFIIVQKIKNYSTLSGSLSLSGEFINKTLLEKICLVRTGSTFNLNVGTTPGGTEIGAFQITDLITTVLINKLFVVPETVYLSGMTSVSFLSIIYKQLDEKPKTAAPGTSGPAVLPNNLTAIYTSETAEDLNLNFNMTSGIGRAGTDWENWFVADGRNGTQNLGGFTTIGFDPTDYPILGAELGENEKTITEDNIPRHSFKIMADAATSTPNISSTNSLARTRTGGGNSAANLGGSSLDATLGKTNLYGKETPDKIAVIQKSKVVLWVQYKRPI